MSKKHLTLLTRETDHTFDALVIGACCPISKPNTGRDWTRFMWGWEDFYQRQEPACSDPVYLEGWRQAEAVSCQQAERAAA
jgi:hypothetical protein